MPTFQGLVSEEQLLQLIAYMKSLARAPATGASRPAATPAPAPAREEVTYGNHGDAPG